jgi:hypothetical protein
MIAKGTVIMFAIAAAVVLALVFFTMRKKEAYTPGNSFTTVKGRILNISEDYKRFQIIFWRRCNGRKIRTKYIFNTINPRWQYKKRDIVKVSYRNWGKCDPAGFL